MDPKQIFKDPFTSLEGKDGQGLRIKIKKNEENPSNLTSIHFLINESKSFDSEN